MTFKRFLYKSGLPSRCEKIKSDFNEKIQLYQLPSPHIQGPHDLLKVKALSFQPIVLSTESKFSFHYKMKDSSLSVSKEGNIKTVNRVL